MNLHFEPTQRGTRKVQQQLKKEYGPFERNQVVKLTRKAESI